MNNRHPDLKPEHYGGMEALIDAHGKGPVGTRFRLARGSINPSIAARAMTAAVPPQGGVQ